MKSKYEIHPVQSDILVYLLFHNNSRFSEINVNKLDTDSFNFHLKSLLEAGLIEKKDTTYSLTLKGKEFANRFDTNISQIEKQAKLGVVLICTKKEQDHTLYLMQQRLKHPFYGYNGFITGKITWGETVNETATRELQEETNLTGTISLAGIEHKMDYSDQSQLLEDKFFYVCKITDIKGTLHEQFQGGRNFWVEKQEIEKMDNLFDDVLFLIEMIETNTLTFQEQKFIVKGF